ncbi:hypothetical protein NQ314_018101 [Rhamnusium bicolor]|uniref:Uncharacterized protein n=1 Tax=Rhamnusium bicolor TaxID=1586634 RepID=A0AAV8WRN7_9CUCU|nr:hypothetical protein NQ314_018101 [Rhamnusium bicolor]
MYTWEEPFAKLVELSRKNEMKQIRATSTIRAIMITCISVLHRSAVYLCILTYVLTGNTLNATYAFTVASFYGILRQAVTMYLPRAVTQFAETRTSVQRIETFLLYEEKLNGANNEEKGLISNKLIANGVQPYSDEEKEIGIHLKNVSFTWTGTLPENTLKKINFDVTSNQLVAVVGKVGGGKSTLLNTILKEITPQEGSVDVEGTTSYASQESWLFGGSIKQNIIFGQEVDLEKYDKVVKACALETDIRLFPHGDETLIGDRGVTLSGGQRARINLARAVYKDADIYLLDDPLAAVDTQVGNHLFEECICRYLRGKCVVLITNQLQYLKNVPTIYLMLNGKIQAVGSYQELKESDTDFTALLVDNKSDECKNVNVSLTEIKEKTVTENKRVDKPVQEREKKVWEQYLRKVNLEQWRSENDIGENSSVKNTSYDTLTHGTDVSYSSNVSYNESFQYILDPILTEDASLLIYSILVISSIVLALSRSISFFKYCMTASTRLHNLMFNKIVLAPIRFFNTNPSGRILNRFSKDIGTIDETLPLTVADTLQVYCFNTFIHFCSNWIFLYPWILIPTVIIVTIFYCLRLVFLATSRDIKRIEAIDIFGGNIGFALTEAVGLTGMFQWGIRQWSEMENQMTSVERIQEYIDLNPESDEKTRAPPASWPEEGNLKFDTLCLRYSQNDPWVLNNLTIEIKSKEKIGIVGRTGAGKSSLIVALFRLTDIDGNIFIDNINIKGIPLSILRSKISIIPQEPMLFSGTLRKNLDPTECYNDHVLWDALESVELKKIVNELPCGLEYNISEGGINFSVGQRQLICLARAVIRNNKILVLDEATANVDPHTDGLIQATIRKKFADCTVLTIAHRLHTIMDSDKVLVMDAGKVVEFDHPHILLLNTNGAFHELVQQTGAAMAENLTAKAEEHYNQYLKKYM